MMRSWTCLVLSGVGLLGAAGCARQNTATAAGPSAALTVAVTGAANGRQVGIRVGERLVIRLGDAGGGGVDWVLHDPTPHGIMTATPQRAQRCPEVMETSSDSGWTIVFPRPLAGMGCGTVTRTFTGVAPGQVVITAYRGYCGEDIRCRPDQQHFDVTVNVTTAH